MSKSTEKNTTPAPAVSRRPSGGSAGAGLPPDAKRLLGSYLHVAAFHRRRTRLSWSNRRALVVLSYEPRRRSILIL
jgi:hypothetical protein